MGAPVAPRPGRDPRTTDRPAHTATHIRGARTTTGSRCPAAPRPPRHYTHCAHREICCHHPQMTDLRRFRSNVSASNARNDSRTMLGTHSPAQVKKNSPSIKHYRTANADGRVLRVIHIGDGTRHCRQASTGPDRAGRGCRGRGPHTWVPAFTPWSEQPRLDQVRDPHDDQHKLAHDGHSPQSVPKARPSTTHRQPWRLLTRFIHVHHPLSSLERRTGPRQTITRISTHLHP